MKNLKLKLFISGLFLLLFGTTIFAADWPRFLGPDANGISPETGLNKDWGNKPPKVLWKADLYNNGHAGPSVAAGRVFIIDRSNDNDKDEVKAFDLNTGKLLWKFAYQEMSFDDYGYARVTPTYDQDKIYTISMMGQLYCLNAGSGKPIWSLNLMKDLKGSPPTWYYACSPVIDGDRLIICTGGSPNLAVLNKNTGKIIWRGGNNEPVGYATPVIATLNGQKQYIVFTGKSVIGVNPGDGKVLWQFPWVTGYDVNAATPLVIGDNQVFISSAYDHGCALLTVSTDGKVKPVWQNQNMMAQVATPVFYKDYIYGISNYGYPDSVIGDLVCLDPKTGERKWKQDGFGKGSILIADGMIFAIRKNGDLIMAKADPSSYQELGKMKLPFKSPEKCWAAPILAEGKIIVRDQSWELSSLLCIDLK